MVVTTSSLKSHSRYLSDMGMQALPTQRLHINSAAKARHFSTSVGSHWTKQLRIQKRCDGTHHEIKIYGLFFFQLHYTIVEGDKGMWTFIWWVKDLFSCQTVDIIRSTPLISIHTYVVSPLQHVWYYLWRQIRAAAKLSPPSTSLTVPALKGQCEWDYWLHHNNTRQLYRTWSGCNMS